MCVPVHETFPNLKRIWNKFQCAPERRPAEKAVIRDLWNILTFNSGVHAQPKAHSCVAMLSPASVPKCPRKFCSNRTLAHCYSEDDFAYWWILLIVSRPVDGVGFLSVWQGVMTCRWCFAYIYICLNGADWIFQVFVWSNWGDIVYECKIKRL